MLEELFCHIDDFSSRNGTRCYSVKAFGILSASDR